MAAVTTCTGCGRPPANRSGSATPAPLFSIVDLNIVQLGKLLVEETR
jgi:hypothetical protein